MNPPPPISWRSSIAFGIHCGMSPRSATNDRSSGTQSLDPSAWNDPASAATIPARVSSSIDQIWPSFSWTWSKRFTPVSSDIVCPSPNANSSFAQARVIAWWMMCARQWVSVITSVCSCASPSRKIRSRGISTSSKMTTASISSKRDDRG
jgi:hypothetical protein